MGGRGCLTETGRAFFDFARLTCQRPVDVTEGQSVVRGQKLLTLEAMKMEHGMTAPFDGIVAALAAVMGDQVGEGAMLVRIEAKD